MQNKSKLNTVLLVILIVLAVIGLVYVSLNNSRQKGENNNLVNNLQQGNINQNALDQTNATQNVQTDTNLISTNSIKPSTVTTAPNDPNVSIYTSYNLGVQFSYLNNGDSSFKSKPVESGDKISLDNGNYVRIFQKLPNKSVEQTIKHAFPQVFNNSYCSVVADGVNKFIIWDNRVPVSYYKATTLDGTPYEKYDENRTLCYPISIDYNEDFIVDPNFPNLIYYTAHPDQAWSYSSDGTKTKQWYETVHLIVR